MQDTVKSGDGVLDVVNQAKYEGNQPIKEINTDSVLAISNQVDSSTFA